MGARTWPAGLAAAVLAVLAAGCQLHAVVDLELQEGGGGRLAVTVEADDELAARAADQPIDPLDQLAGVGRGLPPTWDTDARPTDDGGRAVTLAVRFDDPGELERVSAELADALAAPELDPLDGFRVAVDREEVRVTGGAGLEPTDEVGDLGLDSPAAVARLSDTVDYRIRVRMPGEVVEANAHEREDGTLTWRVPAGDSVDLRAVAARPARPWLRSVVAAGAVALAGTIALGWWLARRRTGVRGRQEAGGRSRPSSSSTSA